MSLAICPPGSRPELVDLNGWAQGRRTEFVEAGRNGAGHGVEAPGGGCVFAERRHGFAGVAADTDARIDFNLPENRHAIGAGGSRAFAVAKNVDGLAAMRASERGHVFNDAQDLDVDL